MGKLYVTATPIGNLEDITKRALDVLKNCDLIAAEDTRHTLKLLNYYGIKNKLVSYHKFNEKERIDFLIECLTQKDMNVALVSDAGTPCISDPGYEIVRAARLNGIEVISVCGPSALTAAISISGLPADKFTFYGFLPKKESERMTVINEIKSKKINTFILYESPKRIVELAQLLEKEFPSAYACFCCDLTKFYEKSIYGPIQGIAQKIKSDPKAELGEYTIVVYTSYPEERKNENLSLEALIVDEMVKNKCSIKDAVSAVSKKYNIPKREVYSASVTVKKIFGDELAGFSRELD